MNITHDNKAQDRPGGHSPGRFAYQAPEDYALPAMRRLALTVAVLWGAAVAMIAAWVVVSADRAPNLAPWCVRHPSSPCVAGTNQAIAGWTRYDVHLGLELGLFVTVAALAAVALAAVWAGRSSSPASA